nr:MAG TPA: Protein of unknown function (DUF983) [Caudoviricetes sp.]
MGWTWQSAPPDADWHASTNARDAGEPSPNSMWPKTPASCSACGLE